MKPYLRKYELVEYFEMEKTALTRWIKYFGEFIPIIRQGDVDCYGPEAKEVLKKIKSLREQLYSLPHIREILANDGSPKFEKIVNLAAIDCKLEWDVPKERVIREHSLIDE